MCRTSTIWGPRDQLGLRIVPRIVLSGRKAWVSHGTQNVLSLLREKSMGFAWHPEWVKSSVGEKLGCRLVITQNVLSLFLYGREAYVYYAPSMTNTCTEILCGSKHDKHMY